MIYMIGATSVGPSRGNWLAAHRADLTLGKTAICIFIAKFYSLSILKLVCTLGSSPATAIVLCRLHTHCITD